MNTRVKSNIGNYYRNLASPLPLNMKAHKEITVTQKNMSQYLAYKTSKPKLSQTNISSNTQYNNTKSNSKINNGTKISIKKGVGNISNLTASLNLSSKHFEKIEIRNRNPNLHTEDINKSNQNKISLNQNFKKRFGDKNLINVEYKMFTNKISKLQKEKNNLLIKNNEQKLQIIKLQTQVNELQHKLDNNPNQVWEKKYNQLNNEYNKIKDNQDQLIRILKLVQNTGFDLEGIIEKYNAQISQEEVSVTLQNTSSDGNNQNNDKNNIEQPEEDEKNNYADLIHNHNHSQQQPFSAKHIESVNSDDLDNMNARNSFQNELLDEFELNTDKINQSGVEFIPLTLNDNNNTVKMPKANVPKLNFGELNKINNQKKKIIKKQ